MPCIILKIAIATDWKYLFDGGQGGAYRCHDLLWCTQKGAVPTVGFWDRFLKAIEQLQTQISWIWTPSHVHVPANQRVVFSVGCSPFSRGHPPGVQGC